MPDDVNTMDIHISQIDRFQRTPLTAVGTPNPRYGYQLLQSLFPVECAVLNI